jgi:transcriptional regulator with XRE-family HTH domain
LRVVREGKGFKQKDVCARMKEYDRAFDKSLLSKMENGVCLPTLYQLSKLALILDCTPSELISGYLYD